MFGSPQSGPGFTSQQFAGPPLDEPLDEPLVVPLVDPLLPSLVDEPDDEPLVVVGAPLELAELVTTSVVDEALELDVDDPLELDPEDELVSVVIGVSS